MQFRKIFFIASLVLVFGLALALPAMAETSCESKDCGITITIKMAFTGEGATDARVQAWTEEIKNVWNDDWEYGACDCPITFAIETKKVDSCPESGFHCVTVGTGLVIDENGRAYVAYMDKVAAKGESIGGSWSGPYTSRPIPSGGITFGGETYTPSEGETFKDAAHEAGHAMGLDDEYDAAAGNYPTNIMGRTWGADAKPIQSHIDAIVDKNCSHKCPNNCCCGNAKIDTDISPAEKCDYKADPTGCPSNQTCTEECACELEPEDKCGDGEVTDAEECDPGADPSGCSGDRVCTLECVCEEKEQCGDDNCGEGEDQSNCCDDCGCPSGQTCSDNECITPTCSTNADCYDGEFCTSDRCINPGQADARCENPQITECVNGDLCCPEGCYNKRVGGDSDCTSSCSNGVCEFGETCYNCSTDCGCTSSESCDPSHGAADERGCYTAVAECGDGICNTPSETCYTCPADCVCAPGRACDPGPTADSMGCVTVGPYCGDGSCDLSNDENCSTCAPDCGCVAPTECAPGVLGADERGCIL